MKLNFAPKMLKLPLATAVSSCLLVACSTTQTPTTTEVATPQVTAPTTTVPTWVNTTPPAYTPPQPTYTQPTYTQPTYQQPLLDADTLALLDSLLYARDMSMVEGDRLSVERYGDLWKRIRLGYKMPAVQHQRIEQQKSWFTGRQDYLNRLTARASRYLHHTVSEAQRRGLPTELALLPIIESSYDPSATSNAAAAGLWQFIPSTGRIYGLNQSANYDGRRDVIESTRAAYDFLTSLYNQFGSWELALAAYNAGPGRIQRAIEANARQGRPTDYWSLDLPKETMDYVPRFMAVAQIIQNPYQHGIDLPAIANHAHFRTVAVSTGVTLAEVSNITKVPVSELKLLNPALLRDFVDGAGPNRIVIPNSVADNLDLQVRNLAGQGYNPDSIAQKTQYIAPERVATTPDLQAAQELQRNNTLPTTAAQITPNNTIIQEPPLSIEERNFIAEQIRQNIPNIEPVKSDGRIDLNAVQTAQSVLTANGQTKTMRFDPNSTLTNTNTATQTNAATRNTGTTHTVGAGETLGGIARQYGLSTQTLASYNNVPTDYKVKKGEKLSLVAQGTSKPAQTNTTTRPAPKPAATAPAKKDHHIVQSGETLTGISQKYNLSVQELANYNNVSTDHKVKKGEKLSLVAQGTSKPAQTNTTTRPAPKPAATAPAKKDHHIVQSGETLTGIAQKYNLSVQELANYNNVSTDYKVARNEKLWLVPQKTTAAKPTNSQPARQKPNTYTVQSGDTLTGVASKHGLKVKELADANNLSENASLKIGTTLTIPTKGSTRPTASAPTSGQVFKQTEDYRVRTGDTLTSLANQHKVSVADLARTNNLPTNAQLKIGQVIKVPKLTTTHTVKKGETLTGLAKKYGVSTEELAKLNNMTTSDNLRINQVITVPNK